MMLLEENMVRRGQKALKRSHKQKVDAQNKYRKYTYQYSYLAGIGDKMMCEARREANKVREN